ncbi:NAD(P)/FAD-dependent oxidoreductase [Cryobacterium frigoriphilum]|uniref:NAD(P)/FAD-dependent oxidoreductase n=1 Tax=Cryobacterium frigoriphilum TaxID=1259150 RepID=A0A4R8ZUJ2_9MICO|nr:NAD(P)/FAD-dependent oxidoreductase [Cryobacterium frigoriphilum]TFD45982.1 NAD(P)/FAD-dependent oxidoreductase [Cryobacterium frigoriphilum]
MQLNDSDTNGTSTGRHDPILSETDIRAAIGDAAVPALLMTVYQFTGDEKWLGPRYAPTRARGLGDHESGGLSDVVQAEIREAAIPIVMALQAGRMPAIAVPSPSAMTKLMAHYLNEPVDERYGPMLAEELGRRSALGDRRIEAPPLAAPTGYKVIVIGVGVAGIVASHYLEQMGVEYTIFERQPEAGGNWWQNTYPGAGVDTPSHLYSFSFADRNWNNHFELRDNLSQYFTDTLDEVGGRAQVQFDTEVLSATFDEPLNIWHLEVRGPDGVVVSHTANVVISAVGVLNKPKLPNVPGRDSFAGESFHSSYWPEGLDIAGKRVAIVGTGASSMQISPAIAEQVEHLTIFQRSPQWVAPFEQFRQAIPEGNRTLLQGCRLYHAWYWLRLFWQFGDKVIEALRVDPDWEFPARAVNSRNDGHRILFTQYIKDRLGDRQDLLEKVLPDYPPFGKRILLDNGWYSTLLRDDVTLVNEGVASVNAAGPVSDSGTQYDVDVLIWATGFDAARFISSMDVRGVGGLTLREAWDDDNPKAYFGVSVPDFPNYFMLGGPNSFPGSGSFMYFMEVQMRYIRDLLTEMLDGGVASIDATEEANRVYNDLVDSTHEHTVWTHPGMSTYYRNSRGRVVFVMPFTNLEYWEMTRRADIENYTFRYDDARTSVDVPA